MNFPMTKEEKASSITHVPLGSKVFLPNEVQVEREVNNLNKGLGQLVLIVIQLPENSALTFTTYKTRASTK